MEIYAIFDVVAGIFGDPIICESDAVAIRSFTWSLGDPRIPDYVRNDSVLYHIGHFNRETGEVTQDVPAYAVARGTSVQVRDNDLNKEVINDEK